MEKLKGIIADFNNDMVVYKDVAYFGPVRRELIELCVEYSGLMHVEILIGGYNDDPRSLYEVPEVRRWIALLFAKWPDAMLWMTPASLWMTVLCLNPEMHSRQPDGQLKIEMDLQRVTKQIGESQIAGLNALREAGMPEDAVDKAFTSALENVKAMIARKKFGEDYIVLHPKDGQPLIYRND